MTDGKIYMLTSYENMYNNGLCYVGSTCKNLNYRLCKHKCDYKRYKKGIGSYYTSFKLFDLFGVDNILIKLVEDNIMLTDLSDKEKHYIDLYNTCNKLNQKYRIHLNEMD